MTSFEFDATAAKALESGYQNPDAIRRRSRVLELLDLRSGERVLDIGCGPGFLAAEMAVAVGERGRVHCIDNSAAMRALANERCAGRPQVTIEEGDATKLYVGSECFDAAVSVQVHEYLADAASSLVGVAQALRSGGRALVVATDWDSLVWNSSDPARMARVLDAFDDHLADPHLPRMLGPYLERAGLRVERCEPFTLLNRVHDPNTYSGFMLELIARFVVGRRGVDAAEAEAWREDLLERGREGEFFFSLDQYFFLARKPEGGV